jgi:ABC-type protease/lipase transport system fused ATPase/permease subunit
MLTGAVHAEAYDAVLPSRSVPTLVALCGLAALLFTLEALANPIRGRLMRIGGASPQPSKYSLTRICL